MIFINVVVSVLIGTVFILCGLLLFYKPPKDINALFGYRTKRSMKSIFLWTEGNKYSAKLLIRYGISIMFLGIIISFVITRGEYALLIIIGLMILASIFLILTVEKRLKKLDNLNPLSWTNKI
ncbi:SdpI family protein [Rummeliibacillus pycnus]|uniref:SdpI family protein n=1 Tax=Rummeliibacillus pycnus TaxID=101070 RepID=UPI0037C5E5C8